MAGPIIIGFVAENANDALQCSTDGIGVHFGAMGYRTYTINLYHPGCYDLLKKLGAENEILFCYGYAGIGAQIKTDGEILWEKVKIPFLSLLYDHPFYYPAHHNVPTKYVWNCYAAQDFLDVQKKYIKSIQPAALLKVSSIGYPNPSNMDIGQDCWSEREILGIYVKSGFDLKPIESSFEVMPSAYKSITLECIKEAQKDSNLSLADYVSDALRSVGVDYNAIWDDFVYIVRVIDQYLRHWRSNQLIENLKDLPITIVGDGWDHIDKTKIRATFLPARPMPEAKNLIKRSKFIFNTHPYGRHIWHERVLFGLETGMRIVSDHTAFTKEHFSNLPSFMGFDWADNSKFEKVKAYIDKFQNKYFDFTPVKKCLDKFPYNAVAVQLIDIAKRARS